MLNPSEGFLHRGVIPGYQACTFFVSQVDRPISGGSTWPDTPPAAGRAWVPGCTCQPGGELDRHERGRRGQAGQGSNRTHQRQNVGGGIEILQFVERRVTWERPVNHERVERYIREANDGSVGTQGSGGDIATS